MNDKNDNHRNDKHLEQEFKLTAAEKKALERLQKDRLPNPDWEERLVGILHDRGFLEPRRSRVIEFTAWRIASVAAVCLILLTIGFILGQRIGLHQLASEDPFMQKSDNISVAASLQQTGSAYLSTLQRFAEMPDTVDSEQAVQGREIAIATLCTAADQVIRLVPKSELAGQLLAAIDTDPAWRPSEGEGGTAIVGSGIIEF